MDAIDVDKLLETAIKGPYEYDGITYIWMTDPKHGKTMVGEVRGWGYLTGKGVGALGLSDKQAEVIQDATGKLLAASWGLAVENKKLRAEHARLKRVEDLGNKMAQALIELIAASNGVAGLHLNGDIAPWEELCRGGRYEEWLMSFDDYCDVYEAKEDSK
jgi:hypothetical protein